MNIGNVIETLRNGRMILLYDADDREGETDMVIPALSAAPADVARMRCDGGGLICVAIHGDAAERLGLPFMSELLKSVSRNGHSSLSSLVEKKGDIPLHTKPVISYSIINSHVKRW